MKYDPNIDYTGKLVRLVEHSASGRIYIPVNSKLRILHIETPSEHFSSTTAFIGQIDAPWIYTGNLLHYGCSEKESFLFEEANFLILGVHEHLITADPHAEKKLVARYRHIPFSSDLAAGAPVSDKQSLVQLFWYTHASLFVCLHDSRFFAVDIDDVEESDVVERLANPYPWRD